MEEERLGASRDKEEGCCGKGWNSVRKYIADEARIDVRSCASIKGKLHSMSAMKGAQNGRLDKADFKNRRLTAGRCWRVEYQWHRTI